MLTYASTWMTKQEVECAKHNSSTLRNNGGGGGGGQANKRKRSHASSNATSGGGRLHHFCVSSPYAVHTGRGLNLAALNSGVHTKKCIVTYMSRMLQPWCAPSLRCCLLDDALGSGPVVLVRVEDFCLVRPAKRSQFLSLIDRYGRECQHQPQPQQQQQEGGDDAMEVFSDNDDDAGDHGSGRRRIGVLVSDSWAEHEAAELRRKVLSCLRVWHLSDENQPLSSKQLESVAKFLAWCATGLDMKLLRTLSSTLSKLLANCRTNAYIKAMVERTSCEQMDRDATMQAQGEMAVGLTQAMQACHAKYWPVFGGKLLKHDLNAELVDLFKGVRFAYELGAVHKAKDSRATRRSLKSGSANDGVSAERSEQDEDDAADDDDQVDEQAQEDDGEDVDRRASKQARTSVGAGEAATPEDQSGWDLQVVRSATSGEEHPAIALDGMMEESEESQEEDHGMLGTDLSTITAGGDDLVAGVHAANAEQAWNEYNGQFGGEGVEQVEETQRMTKRDGYGRARAGLMKAKIPIASEAVVVAGQTGGVESATSGKLDAEVDAKHMVKGRDAVVGGPSMTLAEYAKARGVGASASQEAKWMCESNTGELTEDEWVSKMVECEFGQAFYQLASAWAWLAV
ncbi:hypothetical protein [Sporisorium scitamineum]|uniref:Uncharacterized protein n=1 Tax=Sporisorium scitamineum TaxID=49012 RepID=A0A0F7RY00_9BASI|nr:hypothetical protein [Sporisorium scitamineum]